jgi:hypothetical protein
MGVICRSGWAWNGWRMVEKEGECCRFRHRNPRKHSNIPPTFARSNHRQTQYWKDHSQPSPGTNYHPMLAEIWIYPAEELAVQI